MRRVSFADDRGAVLALGAAAMTAILIAAALVVDLGATRAERASDQVAADAASAAGVLGLVDRDGGGPAGCASALSYLEEHLGTVAGIDCNSFPATCTDSTATVRSAGTVGDKTVAIVHPVPNDDTTMAPSGVGSPDQPAVALDGHPCDRMAVEVSTQKPSFFRSILDGEVGSTTVRSVARVSDEFGRDLIVNLLLLERHQCEALSVGGGGSSGGISVAATVDPDTGDIYPGRISLDSDGTVGCGSQGTIHTNGSGATIQADGAPGCAGELPTGAGHGCGILETYAAGTPGCNLPACSEGGVIAPGPTGSNRRLTRAPIDWQYNCKTSYPSSYEIRGCPNTALSTGYIDSLVSGVNADTTFRSYRAAGYPCTIGGGGSSTVTVPQGNWLIDCGNLRVQRGLTFEGGNLIVQGDITITSTGHLRVNTNNTNLYEWAPGNPVSVADHSANSAWLFMRDGTISKAGGGSFELSRTMVYLSSTSMISLSGGSGSMSLTAPQFGPFKNLALWSESALEHGFAGQASLAMEGVFFLPHAAMVYTGNAGQASVQAQFIAAKARVEGNGSIRLAPRFDQAVKHPPAGVTELIR